MWCWPNTGRPGYSWRRPAGGPASLVVHFHGYDAYKRETLDWYADRYQRMFRDAAVVVGSSRDMCARLAGLGAPAEKIACIPYGVDLEAHRPGDVARTEPVVLAVGRFVPKKAPHLTLLAFAELARTHGSARLVMAGDGPLRDACRQMAKALGLDDRVSFPGAVPPAGVVQLMGLARVFVQHSVTAADGDSEGTPNTILEASASGLPVVATGCRATWQG